MTTARKRTITTVALLGLFCGGVTVASTMLSNRPRDVLGNSTSAPQTAQVEGAQTTDKTPVADTTATTPAPQPVQTPKNVHINAPEYCEQTIEGGDNDIESQETTISVVCDKETQSHNSSSSSSVNVQTSNSQSVSSGSVSNGGTSGSTSSSNSTNITINQR